MLKERETEEHMVNMHALIFAMAAHVLLSIVSIKYHNYVCKLSLIDAKAEKPFSDD